MMPSSVTRSSPPQRGQDVDIARSRLGFAMAVTVRRPSDSGKSLGAWVRKGQPAESGRRVRRRRAWGRAAAGLL